MGLSNVSFGMPERAWLNAAFLAMGMANGLTAVIANPSAPLLMDFKAASDALLNRHDGAAAYIDRFAGAAARAQPVKKDAAEAASPDDLAARAILKGSVKQAASLARKAVEAGTPPGRLVQDHLVPAIMKAGERF
jgi:5-methyltetrahydrofolate--homocysteine methyltransferase